MGLTTLVFMGCTNQAPHCTDECMLHDIDLLGIEPSLYMFFFASWYVGIWTTNDSLLMISWDFILSYINLYQPWGFSQSRRGIPFSVSRPWQGCGYSSRKSLSPGTGNIQMFHTQAKTRFLMFFVSTPSQWKVHNENNACGATRAWHEQTCAFSRFTD